LETAVTRMKILRLMILLGGVVSAQSGNDGSRPEDTQTSAAKKKAKRSAGGDIGSGAANIGGGAARGAGNLAKGSARGAADLVTLHPIDAATSVAGGAVSAGKDVTLGTAKGAGKITRGVGRVFKKVF
jgi:hypothetical protein